MRSREKRLLEEAIAFATMKHQGQERRDGTPYISHPLAVADIVKEMGCGVECQLVAVLHDVLEDTDATEEEVRRFGEDVYVAVELLTRPEGAAEVDYVDAILQNSMASAVKNADKIHNMREAVYCPDLEWARYYVKKVEKYYKGKFSEALDVAIQFAKDELEIK